MPRKKKTQDGPEADAQPKPLDFAGAADRLADAAGGLLGRAESYRKKVSGSADLDQGLEVAAKHLASAKKQAKAAHLAFLGAHAAALITPPDEQTTLLPEDGDGESHHGDTEGTEDDAA